MLCRLKTLAAKSRSSSGLVDSPSGAAFGGETVPFSYGLELKKTLLFERRTLMTSDCSRCCRWSSHSPNSEAFLTNLVHV